MRNKFKLDSKMIIFVLVLILVGMIGYGINYCFYSPSPINKYIASNIYKTPANSAFTDDNFYQCVVDEYNDTNNTSIAYTDSLSDEQLKTITSLYCGGYSKSNEEKVKDVSGLEKLTSLKGLDVGYNRLTSLDVSNNTALTSLGASENQITSLDVSNNTALTGLSVSSNQITSLDVSKNKALEKLWAFDNQITSLDVSNNPALIDLDVRNNQITSLDVSKNTALTELDAHNNQITSLDVSKNPALTDLDVSGNQLTSLDVSNNTALTGLSADKNQITSLDVSNNTALTDLDVCYNQLTSLDVSGATALTELDAHNNQITSLDVSKNTALTKLYAFYNQITSLDVSNNTSLTILSLSSNQITSLDVSNNTALTSLGVGYNQLTSLDVSKNTALTNLYAFYNQITSLDVSKNTALTSLDVSSNQITSLDVSKNTALTELDVYNNQITSLDVSKNTKLTSLKVGFNQITSLDVSKNTALTYLDVCYNQLTSLDVSKNTALTYLSADKNQLTSLDLSQNNNLSKVYIYDNPYILKLKPVFVMEEIEIVNGEFVKLPSQFSPTVSYKLSDGLSLDGDVITANEVGTQTYKLVSKNPSYEETYTIEVVDVTSDKYVVDKSKDYIEVGSDTNEEVLNNITVENGTAIIENGELIVKNGEDEVKRFKLLSTRSSVYDLSNDYIYVGREDDQTIIDNIETNAVISIEDNVLNVSYNDSDYKSYTLVRVDPDYDISNGYIYTLDSDILSNVNVINGDKDIVDSNLVISYNSIELDRIPILTITSDNYVINENYIYTGFSDIDLNNISGVGVTFSVVDNELVVKYKDSVIDSVSIYRLSIDDTSVRYSDGIIYVKDSISYSSFYNSFVSNISDGKIKIEVYDSNDILISSGNIVSGYKLKVLYSGTVIDTYNIELRKEYVDYSDGSKVYYTEEYGVDILKHLNISNTFKNVRELFETDGVVSIRDKSDTILDESNNVKTGDKFVVSFSDSEYFIHLSVKGDVRGTGKIQEEDVVEAYNILRGDKKVEDYYMLAGDINEDGKLKINDVAKLHQYVKNKIESLEE